MSKDRKQKSLSLLCQKFLSFYPHFKDHNTPNILISLDEIANRLEVERRRVYDIVNVLESIEILTKASKNKYIWHGFNSLDSTLSKLKTLSIKSDFVIYTKTIMDSDEFESNSNIIDCDNVPSSNQAIKKEKSLGIMSQKFLMLFLLSENNLISINFAAKVLLGDAKNEVTECGRFKTKIRRLYDIANVLSTVGLIRKCSEKKISSISKPAYEYIGPKVEINRDADYVESFINNKTTHLNGKHSFFDHFKRNLKNSSLIPKFDINTGVLVLKPNEKEAKNKEKEEQKQDLPLSNIQNLDEQYPIINTHHHHHYYYPSHHNTYYDSCYLNQPSIEEMNNNSYQNCSIQQYPYSNVQTSQYVYDTNNSYYDQSLIEMKMPYKLETFEQETTLKQVFYQNESGQLVESASLLENKRRKFTQFTETDINFNYQQTFQTTTLPIVNFNYDSNLIFQ